MPEKLEPNAGEIPTKKEFASPEEKIPTPEEIEHPVDEKKFSSFLYAVKYLPVIEWDLRSGTSPDDLPTWWIDPISQGIETAGAALYHTRHREAAFNALLSLSQETDNFNIYHPHYSFHKTAGQAADIMGVHIGVIEKFTDEQNTYIAANAFRALIQIRDLSIRKPQAAHILRERVHLAERIINESLHERIDLIQLMFAYGDSAQKSQWHERIEKSLRGEGWGDYLGREILSVLFESDSFSAERHASEIVQSRLQDFGIEKPKDMLDAWLESHNKRHNGRIVKTNLNAIRSLDEEHPGAPARLNKQFGIRDFARYPEELMRAQDSNREDTETPYGIVIFPRNDHNGAFYQEAGTLRQLHNSLQGGYHIRVIECDNKFGIGRKLVELNRHYGAQHKISFAVIGGHGSKDGIAFGAGLAGERSRLDAKDLKGHGVKHTSEFFEKNPTFILISCSTGSHEGIGQAISKEFDATVIAPSEDSYGVQSAYAHLQEGTLAFEVEFRRTSKQIYKSGEIEATASSDQ